MAFKVGRVGLINCVNRWDEWRDYFPELQSQMYVEKTTDLTVDAVLSRGTCCLHPSLVGTGNGKHDLLVGLVDGLVPLEYSPRHNIDDYAWGICDSDGIPWDYDRSDEDVW